MTQSERERKVALLYSCGLLDCEIAPFVEVKFSQSIGTIRKRMGLVPGNNDLRRMEIFNTDGSYLSPEMAVANARQKLAQMDKKGLKAGSE